LGSRVAEHFGRPQDIEWAYADGRVRLLQARPMTALPPPPLRLNAMQRKLGSVLLEYLPVRPYPMDMSTWLPRGPAGLMGEMLAYYGIKRPFDDFLHETDGVVDRLVPNAPHPTLGLLRAPFRLFSRARRYDPARWTADPRFAEYLKRVDETVAQTLTTMSWEELLRVPQQAFELVHPVTDFRVDYLPHAGLALLRMAIVLKLLGRPELHGDLMAGAPTRTEDANRALEALAADVCADPALKQVVDGLDVRRLKDFPEFYEKFDAFLREYGHRETATPLLVSPPTWGESPETVLGLMKVLTGVASKVSTSRAREAMRELMALPALRKPKRRERVRRWVEAAQAGMAFREDTHFYFTKPLPILRKALLEMGRRLCDAAIIKQPEDVFHLRLEELQQIGDPATLAEAAKERMRARVRTRAAKREELTGVRLIDPAAIYPPPRDSGDALVSGTPASAGRVTGPVKVIRTPADFAKLESGDVLVCPYTNPSWTPLFQRAIAVVVDSGAAASHAAIVAREYGIPAVMGTATGTAVLKDGQLVTVDGGSGRVTPAQ
jgi:rifampicin phosphotransferase